MNERIKELAEQAELPLLDVDGNCKYGDTYFSKEKFAELVVLECSYLADQAHHKATGGKSAGGYIRQHFGVKE